MSDVSVPGKPKENGPSSVPASQKTVAAPVTAKATATQVSPAKSTSPAKPAAKAKAAVKGPARAPSPSPAKTPERPMTAQGSEPAFALRAVAEQSLDRARTVFARSREASQAMAKGLEGSSEAVQSGLREMQIRITEAMEHQSHAAFSFMRAMTQAHTLSELIDLQSSEMRRGVERSLAEAKDLSSLASSIAAKAAEPMRKAFDLAISSARPHP